jgi:hypothetical protein
VRHSCLLFLNLQCCRVVGDMLPTLGMENFTFCICCMLLWCFAIVVLMQEKLPRRWRRSR